MAARNGVATIAFFLGLSALLLAFSAGHFSVTDDVCYYFMARSFLDHGSFDVPPPASNTSLRIAQAGKEGKYYAPYAFGQALYLSGWLLLADRLDPLPGTHWSASFFLSFAHSVTTAATWTLFLLLLQGYGLRVRSAFLFTLAALFSTLAFPYARTLFPEPLLALTLLTAFFCFSQTGKGAGIFMLAGTLSLVFAVTVRPTAAAFLPAFWLLLGRQMFGNDPQRWAWPNSVRGRRSLFVVLCLITLLGPLLCAGYNYMRFAEVLTTGYRPYASGEPVGFTSPLWFGLAVFLLSPGKALWIFNPLLILSIMGMRRLLVENRVTAFAIGWIFLANLLIHAKWCQPEGGHCWGPRFFVGILPLLLLPAGLFLRDHWHTLSSKLLVASLVTAGVLVQFYGVAVNPAFALRVQGMLSSNVRSGEYQAPGGRYNLWFSPFRMHHLTLREAAASGLAVRHPLVRQDAARYLIIGFPHWSDGLDFWAVHLIKEGFTRGSVARIFFLLLTAGLLLLVLAFSIASGKRKRVGYPLSFDGRSGIV